MDALLEEAVADKPDHKKSLNVKQQRSSQDLKEYSIRQRNAILKSGEHNNDHQYRSEVGANTKRKVSSISLLKKARYRPGAQF